MRPRRNRQGNTPSSWRPGHRREAAWAPAGRLHWLSPSEQLSKARRCPALPPAWPWRISPLGNKARETTRWESHRSGGEKATGRQFRDSRSLQPDVCCTDHLCPLVGFRDNKLLKIGRRHRYGHTAEVRKTHLDLGVGKSCVYLRVEPVDNFGSRIHRRANAL